jgi:hypothetical protein
MGETPSPPSLNGCYFKLAYASLATAGVASQAATPAGAENAALKHQLAVLRRKQHGRVQLTNVDRFFFVQLYRWFPSILKALTVIQPQTLLRWHREGFRRYWRWKSELRRTASHFGGIASVDPGLGLENKLCHLPHIAAMDCSWSRP